MMYIEYEKKRFSASSLAIIEKANSIIQSYASAGFELTLRQLYYQFVARGYIENTEKSYKRIGNIISDARMAGLVSWRAIQDRTRNLQGLSHWDDPASIIDACTTITIDLWEGQDHRIEVWVEKDALIGVVEMACNPLDVSYFSCRGYTSQSEMWAAATVSAMELPNPCSRCQTTDNLVMPQKYPSELNFVECCHPNFDAGCHHHTATHKTLSEAICEWNKANPWDYVPPTKN